MSDRFEFKRYTLITEEPAVSTKRVVYAIEATETWIDHIRHKWGNGIELGDYILLKREGGIDVMKPDEFKEKFSNPQKY